MNFRQVAGLKNTSLSLKQIIKINLAEILYKRVSIKYKKKHMADGEIKISSLEKTIR